MVNKQWMDKHIQRVAKIEEQFEQQKQKSSNKLLLIRRVLKRETVQVKIKKKQGKESSH